MKIPEGEFAAYIFDCDGTLADTMPLHYRAWCAAVRERECDFPEALFYELGGMPTERVIETLNLRHGYSMPPVETARRKESLFLEMLAEIEPIEPVVAIVREVSGRLPSSSPRSVSASRRGNASSSRTRRPAKKPPAPPG